MGMTMDNLAKWESRLGKWALLIMGILWPMMGIIYLLQEKAKILPAMVLILGGVFVAGLWLYFVRCERR